MADKENAEKLEEYLNNCNKEELQEAYKKVEKVIIKNANKDN